MVFQFACSLQQPITHSVGTTLVHQGKNLRLVRTVVGQEFENAKEKSTSDLVIRYGFTKPNLKFLQMKLDIAL